MIQTRHRQPIRKFPMGRPKLRQNWAAVPVGWEGSPSDLARLVGVSYTRLGHMMRGQVGAAMPPGFEVFACPRGWTIARTQALPIQGEDTPPYYRFRHPWDSVPVGWVGTLEELCSLIGISYERLRQMLSGRNGARKGLPPGFDLRKNRAAWRIRRVADLPIPAHSKEEL